MIGKFSALNFCSKDAARTGPQHDDRERVSYRFQPNDSTARAIHGVIEIDRLPPHGKLSHLVNVDLIVGLDENGAVTSASYASTPKPDLLKRTTATKRGG